MRVKMLKQVRQLFFPLEIIIPVYDCVPHSSWRCYQLRRKGKTQPAGNQMQARRYCAVNIQIVAGDVMFVQFNKNREKHPEEAGS